MLRALQRRLRSSSAFVLGASLLRTSATNRLFGFVRLSPLTTAMEFSMLFAFSSTVTLNELTEVPTQNMRAITRHWLRSGCLPLHPARGNPTASIGIRQNLI